MLEKQGYRENVEMIATAHPGRVLFTVSETAEILGVDRRTVVNLINRKNSPLRAVNVGVGKHHSWRISIQNLANFLST